MKSNTKQVHKRKKFRPDRQCKQGIQALVQQAAPSGPLEFHEVFIFDSVPFGSSQVPWGILLL